MAAAELALTDQGLDGLDRDDVATIISSGIGGTGTIFEAARAHLVTGELVSPTFIPMAMANFSASAIALRNKLGGPSYAPLSACASSADAIGQGYRMIRDGYATACLVGGAEAPVNSLAVAGFASMRALSKRNEERQRAGRPFSVDRDGFILGEGACVLLLEALESAHKRDTRVYAEVCGYGQTNDVYHLTAPRADGEGGNEGDDVSDARGGHQSRPSAVHQCTRNWHKAVRPRRDRRVDRRAFGESSAKVAISSTKPMTGHMLGATGAVEAALCVLAIDRGWIPPTINLADPDPACDLDYVPNVARQQQVDIALSNSIAFGGHNVTLAFRRSLPT